MTGKQKQAQRVKGNAKPSSSARAAERLASVAGASTTAGFVGFGALSGDLGYVPVAPSGGEELDCSVDSDFRIVLRKLSKKDTTTKWKALQDFNTLCKEKDVEVLKSVLPYWPRLYCKVAVDADRRVREAGQIAQATLVSHVGRALQPHLKALSGAWLLGQCDVYAPAATAARDAFSNVFTTPERQAKAVIACADDILQYLHDMLFNQSPQNFGSPKTCDRQELELRYEKVVTSSLLALRLFLLTSSSGLDLERGGGAKWRHHYHSILTQPVFWKMAKHKCLMIQGAFYSTVAAFCRVETTLAIEFSDKICPLVLHNLDKTEPVVCTALWEAVLYVVSNVADVWQRVSLRKAVFPKLWSLFRCAADGNASVIYPSFLPLLSSLPADAIGNDTMFYSEFFGNMRIGLTQEKVRASASECAAVVRAFIECFSYCISKQCDNQFVIQYLIFEQLLPLLESSLTEDSKAVSNSPLYSLFVNSVTSWKSGQSASSVLSVTCDDLWQRLTARCEILVDSDEVSVLQMQRIKSLLKAFVAGPETRTKKEVRISLDPVAKRCVSDVSKPVLKLDSAMTKLVCRLSRVCYRHATKRTSVLHLDMLVKLCDIYMGDELFNELLDEAGICAHTQNTPVQCFTQDVLLPWLRTVDAEHDGHSQHLAELTFVIFTQVTDKQTFLNDILNVVQHCPLLVALVEQAKQHPDRMAVTAWQHAGAFGQRMVTNVQYLCDASLAGKEENLQAHWALLRLALSTNNQEPVLGSVYLDTTLTVIREALPSSSQLQGAATEDIHRCVSFVCDVTENFFSNVQGCMMTESAEQLLLMIFKLSCKQHLSISESLYEKVQHTWQVGVAALAKEPCSLACDHGFLSEVIQFLRKQVNTKGITFQRLASLSDLAVSLGDHMFSCNQSTSTMQSFYMALAMPLHHDLLSDWHLGPVVSGHMLMTSSPEMCCLPSVETLPCCVAGVAFNMLIWLNRKTLQDRMQQMEIDTDADNTASSQHINTASTAEVISEGSSNEKRADSGSHDVDESCDSQCGADFLLDVACCVTYCRAVLSTRRAVLCNSELGQVTSQMECSLRSLLKKQATELKKNLLQNAIDRSLASGQLWSLCVGVIMEHLDEEMDPFTMAGSHDRFCELDEALLHTLQAVMPYMSQDDLYQLASLSTAQLITSPADTLFLLTGGLGHLCVLHQALSLFDDPVDMTSFDLTSVLGLASDQFMLGISVKQQEWSVVTFCVVMMQLMTQLVDRSASCLTDKHWDTILCTTVPAIQTCEESSSDLHDNLASQMYAVAAFNLLATIAQCMLSVVVLQLSVPPNLLTEWAEFFSEGAYDNVLPMFVRLADLNELSVAEDLLLRAVCNAISVCPVQRLQTHSLDSLLDAEDDTSPLPERLQTILNHLCPLLQSQHRAVQIAAYKAVMRLMPELPSFEDSKENIKDEDDTYRRMPSAVMRVLACSSQTTQLHLHNVQLGDTADIAVYSSAHTASVAYLMTWSLVIQYCTAASSQLRSELARDLVESHAIDTLMHFLFRLMPQNPTVQLKNHLVTVLGTPRLTSVSSMFDYEPDLSINGDVKGSAVPSELQHIACSLYRHALRHLPAVIRQWWNNQDKRTASIVDKFTSRYVSPLLSAQEMDTVQQRNMTALSNMTIKTRPVTREVIAVYTVEEVTMELIVTLAVNHPLGPISVECSRRVGVANNQWRNWMLQLTMFLSHQNGSILDGLLLWKRNVDKRFEGVDDCMVCFSVIHASNYQLPRLQCRTCKKKFHSACLYKWFSTSNNSTCPLCRNLF